MYIAATWVIAFVLLVMPELSFAAGLVPCGGPGEMPCQFCHTGQLVQNIINWIVGIMTFIMIGLVIYAGFRLLTSGGDTSAKETAKNVLSNAIIGYVIVLAAWLAIDLLLRTVLDNEGEDAFGPWNLIECVPQPRLVYHPTPGMSRGVADGAVTPFDPSAFDATALSGGSFDKVCEAASEAGIAGECSSLQALMYTESSGCVNKESDVGALGCMQIMPDTARSYDPALRSLSDAEVRDKLLNDDDYNIRLGVAIYKDALDHHEGNRDLVYAEYNGGRGALLPSRNCEGKMRWECEWDGADCLDGVGSDCRENTGYRETRNYVIKINGMVGAMDR